MDRNGGLQHVTTLRTKDGKVLTKDGKPSKGDCCCGCCCVGGIPAPQYGSKQKCEQCENVHDCYESVTVNCDYKEQPVEYADKPVEYADADEFGNCPEGFNPTGDGRCEKVGDCPEGFTPAWDGRCEKRGECPDGYTLDGGWGYCVKCDQCPDGFTAGWSGNCFKQTTVSDCADCKGNCNYRETIGPCGSFGADCERAECLVDCCLPGGICQTLTREECLRRGGQPRGVSMCATPCNENCFPPAACDETCEWPESITVSLEGTPKGWGYVSPFGTAEKPLGVGDDVVYRTVGSAIARCWSSWGLPEGSAVLDRQEGHGCGGVTYRGAFEVPTARGCFFPVEYGVGAAEASVTLLRSPWTGAAISIETGKATAVATKFGADGSIAEVKVCSAGSGYTSPPPVRVWSQSGTGAKLTAKIEDGRVVEITVDDGGKGYGPGGWRIELAVGGFTAMAQLNWLNDAPALPNCGGNWNCRCDGKQLDFPSGDTLAGGAKCGLDLLRRGYDAAYDTYMFPYGATVNGFDYMSFGYQAAYEFACIRLIVAGGRCSIS